MPMSRRTAAAAAVILAIIPLSGANAQVVTNVLLEWRTQLNLCQESDQRDRGALMHVAMFEAINATSGTPYRPYTQQIRPEGGSSVDAAAAQADIKDPFFTTETPGRYVPTSRRVGVALVTQAPWIMTSPAELRPASPPALTSAVYARDLAEIARLGGKVSTARTAAQTDMARFWAPRDVRIVLRQLVGMPGRTLLQDARFLALAEMAWADSYVSMMDGKYAYDLWRPVTAIRGAAGDGNDATVADLKWEPLLQTPAHPEYPCGHCLSAGAVGAVIAAEFGERMPDIVLDVDSTMLRRYTRVQDYIDEVTESRMLVGVHYRFSLDAGRTAGIALGRLAGQRHFTRTR
jgi:hypothetical protein